MAGGPDFDIIIAEKWGAQGLEEHKKTRRQQAEETKRHIFEVALALLDRRAFEQIKVRDIVEAAQVSVGTFYNYYATKLDVYYETYQLADEYFEDVVAPALIQPTARERILYFFDEYARYSSEITDISLTKLLYNSNNKCFDRPSEQGIRRVLGEQVQQGLQAGEFHSEEGGGRHGGLSDDRCPGAGVQLVHPRRRLSDSAGDETLCGTPAAGLGLNRAQGGQAEGRAAENPQRVPSFC